MFTERIHEWVKQAVDDAPSSKKQGQK